MKFGIREINDVVFKAIQSTKIGDRVFQAGEPVLYIDSAKTSTIEGAATTVYAQGGKGNSRLIAWEGEKTLTFTVEDALLSEVGFAILSGAGLFNIPADGTKGTAMVHKVEKFITDAEGAFIIKNSNVSSNAPVFIMSFANGSINKKFEQGKVQRAQVNGGYKFSLTETYANTPIFVDYYVKANAAVNELVIDAENFAGYYYVEGETKFRRESDGKDLKATLVFPKVKIQSNFTFSMSSSGDPSTFTFTMDAMPGYTMFEQTKKVLLAMQIIDETSADKVRVPVTTYNGAPVIDDTELIKHDSILDWTGEEFFDFIPVNESNESNKEVSE